MNGIIVGAGRIGYNLASIMVEKHDIIIIDNNRETCKNIQNKLDCYVLKGTGTNTKILEEAGIATTDFFAAVTPNDEVNFLSSAYAKDNGVNTILSRVNNQNHISIFKKLDIPVINAENSAVKFISRNIIRPTAQNLVTIGKGTAEILELTVKNKEVIGKALSHYSPNNKYIVVTVYSGDDVIIPTDNTKLKYKDNITVLIKDEYIQEVKDFFTKEN